MLRSIEAYVPRSEKALLGLYGIYKALRPIVRLIEEHCQSLERRTLPILGLSADAATIGTYSEALRHVDDKQSGSPLQLPVSWSFSKDYYRTTQQARVWPRERSRADNVPLGTSACVPIACPFPGQGVLGT